MHASVCFSTETEGWISAVDPVTSLRKDRTCPSLQVLSLTMQGQASLSLFYLQVSKLILVARHVFDLISNAYNHMKQPKEIILPIEHLIRPWHQFGSEVSH